MAALALAAGGTALAPAAVAAPAAGPVAPGAPGTLSRFDLARKDCVGTARNSASKVWFTVAGGVLSDVYEPTIDNSDVHSLDLVVTDGRSFTDLQSRDLAYTVAADDTGMQCTVTATSAAHGYRLVTTYATDPDRDTVLMSTRLQGLGPGGSRTPRGLSVLARLDAHVNGNGGGGAANGGADSGVVTSSGVPVIGDAGTVSQAANRDYAVPTYMALGATSLRGASVGYAGTASDGLTSLDAARALGTRYASAPNGHVVATADVTPGPDGAVTLALGFGRTQQQATDTSAASLRRAPAAQRAYTSGWQGYDAGLAHPAVSDPATLRAYWLSANVLKASEDKTFPGAIAAGLGSPWGQAVSAGDLPDGQPVYFGSYREVFARDLYEAATGLLADGDVATARAATTFLFLRQQQPDGRMPRNSLLNGKVAPDTGGDQLDETAYPILLAQLTGLGGDAALYRDHVVPAADFLVAHGPSFGNERWEEQSGYSPSTIAAEIAGLTAAATIAHGQHDDARARLYQATADTYQRGIKGWTVTSTGPLSSSPYFIRLSKDGDPNAATAYDLGNGSVTADQRSVVDGGFQELVRLGELPADDPAVLNSLKVLDSSIAASTPSGTGYYRYGTPAPGSEDGYGDCWVPDPTDCPVNGQPWPTTDKGSGHLWPVLSGERAETALSLGDRTTATGQLQFLLRSASGVGLVPEQAWEDPDLPASSYGTDPTVASIGFQDGKAAGSAAPLTWAQAQLLRLVVDQAGGRIVDRPAITTDRYVTHPAPGALPVTITSPPRDSQQSGSVTVTGTTAPGARVDVGAVATDAPAVTPPTSTTADGAGAWSASVPVGFGTNVVTAAATDAAGTATGTAQVSVVGQLVGGTTVLDAADPTGDDSGPGTYQYPTASDFHAGAFDVTRFEVLTKGGTVYLRTTLANLDPTFGSALGAQLLDVYVHRPGAAQTSTAAAYPSRNYTVAPADAWSQHIEVQGFAAPVWDDTAGNQVGTVGSVVASATTRTITVALPAAQLGTPGTGWSFTVALTGQDGFSGDKARSFSQPAGGYSFGVCPSGGSSPICPVDPGQVAKVIDTVPPAGVAQADEWDLTTGKAVLRGVPVS